MSKAFHHTTRPFADAEDQEFLAGMIQGDREAFRRLYERYWRVVYSIAQDWLKSPEGAQDIVQDVFSKLWEKRARLGQVKDIRSYLFIMARNEIVSAVKSQPVRAYSIDSYMEALPGNDLQPDHALGLKQSEAVVHAAVEQLSPRQKLIFQLTRQEGLSHEEIADRLGLTKETVGNHATRALQNIRGFLREHIVVPD